MGCGIHVVVGERVGLQGYEKKHVNKLYGLSTAPGLRGLLNLRTLTAQGVLKEA